MAWFMCFVFKHFVPICERQGDTERAQHYRRHAEQMAHAAEQNAWDGDWYLRGFYDDGDQLGGKDSDEWNIDLHAQTWALVSGAGGAGRFEQGMQAVRSELVDAEQQLIKLLAPPFQKSA